MVLGARTRYATRFALFRVQIFRGSPLDHENHENITPRKIPAIRYIYILILYIVILAGLYITMHTSNGGPRVGVCMY